MTKTVVVASVVLLFAGVAAGWGSEDPVQDAVEACKPEIETYCSQVAPGDGRLLACFYAHEDKLSGRCGWALYEAAAKLEHFSTAVTHVANACWDDLVEHCADVEMGEGRVAECLLEHENEVSEGCQQAIDDVGLEMVEDEG